MYSIGAYGSHIRDKVRTNAYIKALERYIGPETTVLDLGAGTGFFSLMACHLGAKHVYAIEVNPAVQLLSKQAQVNGFADRITLYQDQSTQAVLPVQVDLIVSDLRGGMLPLFGSHIQTLHDAYTRFLKPGGVLIPQQDTIYLAAVCDEETYKDLILNPWSNTQYPFDMSVVLEKNVHGVLRQVPKAEQVVGQPVVWNSVRYGLQVSPTLRNTVSWAVEGEHTIHFIAGWFESTLVEGISYSTSPHTDKDARPQCYSGIYLPLKAPIHVTVGERLEVEFIATYAPSKDDYTYSWNTNVLDIHGQSRIAFKQTTFFYEVFPNLKQYLRKS